MDSSLNYYVENMRVFYYAGGRLDGAAQSLEAGCRNDCLKACYLQKGSGFIHTPQKRIPFEAGSVCLLPPDVTLSFAPGEVSGYWFFFDCKSNDNALLDVFSLPLSVAADPQNRLAEAFERITVLPEKPEVAQQLHRHAHILRFLTCYLERCGVSTEHIFRHSSISDVLSYIDKHLGEELTLEHLCSVFHLHSSHLTRNFRREVGYPPSQYIANQRIEKAKIILSGSDKSIEEITEIIGFKSTYYFSRAFKQKTGLSPTQYRKMLQSKAPQ